LAGETLSLYQAQTSRAKTFKTILRWMLGASLPLGSQKISLSISADEEFARFLASQAGCAQGTVPTMGILAGNPGGEGQRFVILLFDSGHKPVAVVKAGSGQRSRELIQHEATFLEKAPGNVTGVPKLRGRFHGSRSEALGLEFIAGDSPRPEHDSALPALLSSWVSSTADTDLEGLPAWLTLNKAVSGDKRFAALTASGHGRIVKKVIQHGDFAPWNIKVSANGEWTVLDWERGDLAGIPGWDWYHYVIQRSILVDKKPVAPMLQQIEELLGSSPFRDYAKLSGIGGIERTLLLAYLFNILQVIKPSEGYPETRQLLEALLQTWRF
jgi:hypothetical protein